MLSQAYNYLQNISLRIFYYVGLTVICNYSDTHLVVNAMDDIFFHCCVLVNIISNAMLSVFPCYLVLCNHILNVSIILLRATVSCLVVLLWLCCHYCTLMQYFHYFILFYLLYCMVILYQFSVDYPGTCWCNHTLVSWLTVIMFIWHCILLLLARYVPNVA